MIERLRGSVLGLLRRNGRPVAWTPSFMGFGNVLLVALWAHEETLAGRPTLALATQATRGWFEVFPGLRAVLVERGEVRFRDRRVMPWSSGHKSGGTAQADGPQTIDMAAVGRLLDDVLLPGSPVLAPGFVRPDDDRLVINVRRGDYYSDPEVRGQYGFDLEPYLRLAVEESSAADGRPGRIVVVSDGMDWCRARLGWLADWAPVEYATSTGAVGDFLTVAAARRIVLTNSTFSYWAAYVSNAVHGDNHAQVWAPRFFDRSRHGGRSWLLDERWSIVEDIPGGWDS